MTSDQSVEYPIENQDIYGYQMYRYSASHSELCLKVTSEHEQFYLLFIMVKYFMGPDGWNGAKFQIASDEDCLRFIHGREVLTSLSDENLLNIFKLYGIERPGLEVKIVANNVVQLLEEPSY